MHSTRRVCVCNLKEFVYYIKSVKLHRMILRYYRILIKNEKCFSFSLGTASRDRFRFLLPFILAATGQAATTCRLSRSEKKMDGIGRIDFRKKKKTNHL